MPVGSPARVARETTDQECQLLHASAAHYAVKAAHDAADLRKV
jgi:hypothetical protein